MLLTAFILGLFGLQTFAAKHYNWSTNLRNKTAIKRNIVRDIVDIKSNRIQENYKRISREKIILCLRKIRDFLRSVEMAIKYIFILCIPSGL